MTERLYYRDAALLQFQATVVDRAADGHRIYLDRTAFYPTSGGQPHDLGTLDGIAVVDVIDEEDRVAHLLAAPLPGTAVRGLIDAGRRRDHMEQHTGQHLLSAVLDQLFGWRTESVHFGPESSSIDLAAGAITASQAEKAEWEANLVVRENRPVSVSFEEASTVTGLRKASDRIGTLRIITIEGLDRSACGGTHVSRTGEIGAIQLRKIDKAKQLVRVEFLCGGRAITSARRQFDLLSGLAASRSAAVDELPALLEKERADLRTANSERKEAAEQLGRYRAVELYGVARPDAAGIRWLVERRPGGGAESLRPLAQAVTALEKAVLVGLSAEPPAIILASSADSGVDAGRELKEKLPTVGGRGGGSPRVAQGSVPDQKGLEVLASMLLDR